MDQKKLVKAISIFFIFFSPIIAIVFYGLSMPVSFDEACTFLLFTSKGAIVSMITYPAPNNHVLFSVFTNISYHFNHFTPLFALRLPSIFCNLTTIFIVFWLSKNRFGFNFAFILTAISSMLFMNIYYGYMARGYGFYNLMFIIAFFTSLNIIENRNKRKNWLWFSIASILGLCTIPSFLYPFLMLNVLILWYHFKNIRAQFLAGIIVVFFVGLFYLPIIYNEGVNSIINNRYVSPEPFVIVSKALPRFAIAVISEISGIHWVSVLIILVISTFFIFKNKNKLQIRLVIVFSIMPFLLLAIHSVIPFVRVFNFYGFLMILFIILPFKKSINDFNLGTLLIALGSCQILLFLNFNNKIDQYENKDLAANITASQLIPKIIGNKKYFCNKVLLSSNLRFELISKGFNNAIITEKTLLKIDANTIQDFDYAILSVESDITKKIKPNFKTPYYNIYSYSKPIKILK